MSKLVVRSILFGIMTAALLLVSCGQGVDATDVPAGAPATEAGGEPALAAVSAPAAGATMLWVDGSVLAFVPEGGFEMGEAGGTDNPLHSVELSSYWIQQGEVTNRQYGLCVSSGACEPPLDPKRALGVDEPTQATAPVAGVSWEQANAYCSWIQGNLPTEAQWEKAARGPESWMYPWGDAEPSCDLLNFDNCVGFPTEAGRYLDGRSHYGLFDMAGNVFEWTFDWYDAGYYPASPAADPTGPESGTLRTFRSSAYYSFMNEAKLFRRLSMQPEKFRDDLGFRCVVQSPTIQTPYCQASAIGIIPGADGSVSNSASCAPPEFEQGNAFCAFGNSYANIFLTSGQLSSTDKSSICNYGGVTDGMELWTCGPGNLPKQMTVCGECSNLPSAAELACPPGYASDDHGGCSWGIPGMESVGGCPAGWTPGGNGGVCGYIGPKSGEHCPIGSYYDPASGACAGNVPSGTPVCAAGFTYDAQAQCCAAPAGGSYPGCGPNEYVNEQGFCAPLLISATSCVDITVSYINCEVPTPPGGEDGGGGTSCQNIVCNSPYEFDGVCSCVYNPKP